MKKLFITFLLIFIISNLFAEIGVKSFRKLENDMDARINEPLKDQNGDVCAIIKVQTTQTGFTSFDCGMTGVVKTVQKPSEIWVYVPYGAKRITITHPQLGMIRDYYFPVPIEKATVYEMVLITGRVETTVVDEMTSQWLVINPDPADAMIYLNDQFVKSGMFQSKLKPGTYTYRVELALYHNEAGTVQITDSKKEIDVKLKPAFGYFSVNTEPESGAKVIVDGKTQIKTTPFLSEPLSSGIYTVQVVKEMYQPAMQKLTIIDGQTTPLNFVLQPNFGEVTIKAPVDATVYVNNQQKSIGSWQGKLNAGIYYLEARSDKHRPDKKELTVIAGNKDTINLQPEPIYGSLDVITYPPGAKIVINGKENGTTPNTIYNLPIGDCSVQLIKDGYAPLSKNVIITDGRSTELNETLTSSDSNTANLVSQPSNNVTQSNVRLVNVTSNPSNAKLYIDDLLVGQTPFEGSLSIGYHNIRAEQGMEKVVKNVILDQTGGETNFKLTFSQQAFMETAGKLLNSDQNTSSSDLMPSLKRFITISSNPQGVNLYIDGNQVGQTPYSGEMSFGNHNISIEQNGQKVEKIINVAQSGGETDFNLSFGQQTQTDNLTNLMKLVNITSNPSNADVYVDGKLMGKTPTKVKLNYGSHSFIITNGSKKNTQEIEINDESSAELYFGLFDCYSDKTITSNPSGASVLVNGEDKGTTPLRYLMLNKQDEIVINQKGYEPYKASILCDSKGLTVNLKPDKGKVTHLYLEAGLAFPLIEKSASTLSSSSPNSSSTSTTSLTDSLIFSFRIGIVKTTGMYVKLTTNMSFTNADYTKRNLPTDYYYITTSSTPVFYTSRFGAVGGIMLNVKPIMFFAGAGYGFYNRYTSVKLYNYSNDNLVSNSNYNMGDGNSISGIEYDAGMIIYKGFGAFSISFSSIKFKYNELTCGVGIVF